MVELCVHMLELRWRSLNASRAMNATRRTGRSPVENILALTLVIFFIAHSSENGNFRLAEQRHVSQMSINLAYSSQGKISVFMFQ